MAIPGQFIYGIESPASPTLRAAFRPRLRYAALGMTAKYATARALRGTIPFASDSHPFSRIKISEIAAPELDGLKPSSLALRTDTRLRFDGFRPSRHIALRTDRESAWECAVQRSGGAIVSSEMASVAGQTV